MNQQISHVNGIVTYIGYDTDREWYINIETEGTMANVTFVHLQNVVVHVDDIISIGDIIGDLI